jgi:hypothetical protein
MNPVTQEMPKWEPSFQILMTGGGSRWDPKVPLRGQKQQSGYYSSFHLEMTA